MKFSVNKIYGWTMALLTESSDIRRKSVQKALSDNHVKCSAALDKPCVLFAANSTLHKPIQSIRDGMDSYNRY
ncbi:hypothetical protein EOS_08930 [Caballeronia mineralivorans PML1(12)]|uniref:Uncharacterized protein n=1 Tax=Caballeronia mineralivorans PML1(12) TaxID=908627 RepID=A0A0J1G303_9BURK|nr:hypothetical protein EOS_08930 [Caballeronia mineralivorans PML1(12)]